MDNTVKQQLERFEIRSAPEQVCEVIKLWLESAERAGEQDVQEEKQSEKDASYTMSFWRNRIHIREQYLSPRRTRWCIGDNYDRHGTLVYYSKVGPGPGASCWFWMPSYGEEKPLAGSPDGFEEAKACARLMWTPSY